jgi:AcrR family transcriptional regulator
MSAGPGLRERKKAQTRRTIRDAAFTLFAQRGYEATTVADIAEEADIAPRTFFAYFPAKEDVVYADYEEVLGRFDEVLAGRPAGTTAIDGMRAWIAETAEDPPLDPHEERLVARLALEHPALAARRLALLDRMEQTLAREVSRDLGPGGDPLHARMVAAAAIAVLAALDRTVNDEEAPADDETAMHVLDQAFAFLDAGLAAWGGARR